jgi:hypothetical protein
MGFWDDPLLFGRMAGTKVREPAMKATATKPAPKRRPLVHVDSDVNVVSVPQGGALIIEHVPFNRTRQIAAAQLLLKRMPAPVTDGQVSVVDELRRYRAGE